MSGKTLLVVNNEYTNRKIIWGNREEGKAANDDDIAKGKNAHGISVVEHCLRRRQMAYGQGQPL